MAQADGSVLVEVNMDTSQAEKDLARLKKKIADTERTVEDTQKKRDAAHQKEIFSAAELDAEKMKLEEIKSRLQEIRYLTKDKSIGAADRDRYTAMLPGVKEELSDQQTRVRLLQAEYNKVAGSVERYDNKLKEARSSLDTMKQDAGQLVQQINSTSKMSGKMAAYMQKADKAMDRFGRRMKSVVAGALVFNIVSAGLRKLVEWGGKVIKTNDKAQAAIAKLKGALLTLAQPLVEVLIPAFTFLVEILAEAAAAAAALVSKLFGKTAEQSAEAAKNLNAEIEALEGTGKAAKKAGQSIASFDELNLIGSDGAAQGTSGGIAPDFTGALAANMQSFGNVLQPVLSGIQNLFSTLSPVFMWIKDTVLSVMEKAIELAQKIAFVLEEKGPEIERIISGIGEIFLVVWELVEPIFTLLRKKLGKTYSSIIELIDLLPLIIDGFSGLVDFIVGVFTGDWDRAFAGIEKTVESCKEYLFDTWESAKERFRGVGAWVDKNIIQPVSEFFTGLWSGIAQSASDCWSDICEFFRPAIDWFSELFGSVKQTIDDIFYNIGVIASGCWEIVKPVVGFFSDMWDSVTSGAKEAWEGIKEAFSSVGKFFSNTFTAAWEKVKKVFSPLGDVFVDIKEGVLDGFKKVVNKLISGINNVVAIPFNGINDALKSVKSVNIFGLQPFSGLKTISVPRIPYLAQGAVIPPNREFMAVLGDQRHGTNIEAPLATIEEAVARVTGDQSERMLAALYALIEIVEQKDLNVQIGDDEIGRANARYTQTRGVQINSGAFANAY